MGWSAGSLRDSGMGLGGLSLEYLVAYVVFNLDRVGDDLRGYPQMRESVSPRITNDMKGLSSLLHVPDRF